jgi:cytoskeleton protein RodZ
MSDAPTEKRVDQGVDSEMPIRFADTAQDALDASKTAGQMMREAREAQGLHVAALAVSLKVPVKKLEALEGDRLEELPDAVFVRALASSVCRALKMDARPVLAKLPQLNTRVLDQAEKGVNVAFRTRADGPAPSPFAQMNRPVVIGVLALLLAAIVLMLLPDFKAKSDSSSAASATAANNNNGAAGVSMGNAVNVPATPVAADTATAVINPSVAASPASATSAAGVGSAPQALSTATLTVSPALSTPTVASPTLVITPPAAQAAAPVPADAIVVFSASGETWVEVRDSGGKILLQRTLQSGEKAGVSPPGKGELSVIVGRANLTQVTLRGKAFDLAPVSSKDAVARFQVK